MSQVFVFTAGNSEARAHLDDSIRNPVDPQLVLDIVPSQERPGIEKLQNDEGGIWCWGAVPGRRNKPTWESMQTGDLVLCVFANRYRFVAKVAAKTQQDELAAAIWGRAADGKTWEYMYFLTHPEEVDASVADLAPTLNSTYRGFTRISSEKVARIVGEFGSLDSFVDARLRRQGSVAPADDFMPVLQRYAEEHVIYTSAARGRRYRVLACGGETADVHRVDGGEQERVTLNGYRELLGTVRREGSVPVSDVPGNRVRGATLVQGKFLGLSPDGQSVVDVSTAPLALAAFRELLTNLQVDQSEGGERLYKPAMVASLLDAIEQGRVEDNKFTFDELLPGFLDRAQQHGIAAGEQQAAYAFYHLAGDRFWMLAYPRELDPLDSTASPHLLRTRVSHATLKDTYWDLLQQSSPRQQLTRALELKWFTPSEPDPMNANDLSAVVASFAGSLSDCGLRFGRRHDDFVRAFIVSLATKRFAILTGLSGSGKTQIGLRFGEWLGSEALHVEPVRPDWTGPEALLGYEDALQPRVNGLAAWVVPTPLRFMLRAAADPHHPYLLLLDEMNLAHVERYFADILSGLESDQPCIPNLREELGVWRRHPDGPERIRVPDNLFVVGTVNVDETTYMFSPKVLDRANTFEFRVETDDLDESFARPGTCTQGAESLVSAYLEVAADLGSHGELGGSDLASFNEGLRQIHRLLSESGFEFGHRVFFEANRFARLLSASGQPEWKRALDLQVLQKILPRLHGSRRRLEGTLCALGRYCYNQTYEPGSVARGDANSFDPLTESSEDAILAISFDKIQRMTRSLRANQFTSFTE